MTEGEPVESLDQLEQIAIGAEIVTRKTISESDVYLFAGITGDFHPNHVDEVYMSEGSFGGRIAHGALTVGFMSAASTAFLQRSDFDAVSLGYDGIRFLAPVRFGDTLTVRYRISSKDPEKRRTVAEVEVTNQRDEKVAIAIHHLKFVR